MCARPSKGNMWSYLETSRFFDGLSLLHLCLVRPARPASSPLSFLFPPIQPFSCCHPWAGGPSLWEVKGHRGWEGSRQVVRAPWSPFPTARVKCCWTLTPVGLLSKIGVEGNSASQTLFRTGLSIGGEKTPPPHPNCGQCPLFVCWSSRVGRPAATSQDKTSEKPIQHVMWPPGSIADSQGSNAGNLWGFSSMEVFIHWNLPFWPNSKWLMIFS